MCAKPDAEMAERLMDAARLAADTAYAPYSNFPVGAAVLTADGTIVTGCNVENASYPLTNCAERVAIGTAVAAGAREIQAIAVYAPRMEAVTPCGACRQVINEFKPATEEIDQRVDEHLAAGANEIADGGGDGGHKVPLGSRRRPCHAPCSDSGRNRMNVDSWWKSRRRCSTIATWWTCAFSTSLRPWTISVISRTVLQIENVEIVFGGRCAPVEKTDPG